MYRLSIDIAWKIEGPFLSAGSSTQKTLDKSFHRAAGLTLSVSKTHVKGKMREAAQFIADVYGVSEEAFKWWFGDGWEEGAKGERIFFSDLRPALVPNQTRRHDLTPGRIDLTERSQTDPLHESFLSFVRASGFDRLTRTAIDAERGARARAHSLRVEETQPRGLALWWSGRIEAAGPNEAELLGVAALLKIAAGCIEQFGADKGAGFGVVRDLAFTAALQEKPLHGLGAATLPSLNSVVHPHQAPSTTPSGGATQAPGGIINHDLEIIALEPVFIASVKRPFSNFTEGLGYIPGSALKGALAARINLETGYPLDAEVGEQNQAAATRWPHVVSHFAKIRFLHGYPGGGAGPQRSWPVPLSAFADDKKSAHVWDLALGKLPANVLPHFLPDCSDLGGFCSEPGRAGESLSSFAPAKSVELRTEIDPGRGAAAREKLFGYSEIAELTRQDGKNAARQSFFTTVSVPDDGKKLSEEIWHELEELLPRIRLGKTNGAVSIRLCPFPLPSLGDRRNQYGNERVVLTLASDALLPIDIGRISGVEDMTPLYDLAWKKIFKFLGYDHREAKLIESIFAQQTLRGGWAGKRGRDKGYRGFYLTRAGSVFVTSIRADDNNTAFAAAVKSLESRGIPVVEQGLNWKNCSYVPENGYGEIVVCHPWHLCRREVN